MRSFRYIEPTTAPARADNYQEVTVTEDEILRTYYPYWCGEMCKADKFDLISAQHCIDDFVTIHWAWEVVE